MLKSYTSTGSGAFPRRTSSPHQRDQGGHGAGLVPDPPQLLKEERQQAELVFYYSGHGLPSDATKEPFLIPVDVNGNKVGLFRVCFGHPRAGAHRAHQFLEPFFRGARNDGLVANKGINR